MKKETKQTIAMLLIVLFCLFADSIWNKIFGQAFAGLNAGNKTIGVQMGVEVEKVEICVSYSFPYMKNDKASITGIQAGRKIDITQWDNDNYSVMPYFGYGYLKWQDFTKYNTNTTGNGEIIDMSSFNPLFGIQLCKDSHAGQVFLGYQYCKENYFSIGFKCYPSKL